PRAATSDPPLRAERREQHAAREALCRAWEIGPSDLREEAEVPDRIPGQTRRAADPGVRAFDEEDGEADVDERLPRAPPEDQERDLRLEPHVAPDERRGADLQVIVDAERQARDRARAGVNRVDVDAGQRAELPSVRERVRA